MPVGESSPSQSKQDKIDMIMDNLKLEIDFEPPEVKSMINALQDNDIDNLANTMNSFAKSIKDSITQLVNEYDEVKESIGDVFAAAGLKYFDSNLDNPYIKTMNNFYASVASKFFETDAFQNSPEINNQFDLYNVATGMDMCFGDCLKKTFNIDVKPSELAWVKTDGELGEYDYTKNTLSLKWDGDSDGMFNTLFHELTHKVQHALVDNSTSPSLANYKKYIDMLKYNFLAYYDEPDHRYIYQPLELEAHRNGDTFQKLYELAQDDSENKDNIFNKDDIKASFLNVQKKINDDANYGLNGNSSDSDSDSESDSESSFDETLHKSTTLGDALNSKLKKWPASESSPSQSNQDKIDGIMENLKQVEFQLPEVQSMINALQDNDIDNLANTMNGFVKPIKYDILISVNRYDGVKESIGDVLAAASLKYFDSNLDNPYISTMNSFYANVASKFFQTDTFKDIPEIKTMGDLYTVAEGMDLCFKDCLKKDFDIDVGLSEIKFETTDGTVGGYKYGKNILSVKLDGDSDGMFNTIFHELTHKVQYAFVNNSTSPSLANYKHYIDMLKYNFLVYYDDEPYYRYVYQPLEAEAHKNGNTFQTLHALAQGYGKDKDNLFDPDDIKTSFLKLQKKINDDGHYDIDDNSSDSEFDSDFDSELDFDSSSDDE